MPERSIYDDPAFQRVVAEINESGERAIGGILPHYSAALDEMYQLRCAAAYEAVVIANTLLGYASLSPGVRLLEGMHERLTASARGDAGDTYADVPSLRKKQVLRATGAPETLTRAQWEARQR